MTLIIAGHEMQVQDFNQDQSQTFQSDLFTAGRLYFATDSPHCQNSCHPHPNNINGEKGDNHGTIQCRTQTSYTEQTFIT